MLGYKDRDQGELFITGSLRQLLPDDHILVRVDRVLDLAWLRSEVADLYCAGYGLHEALPDHSTLTRIRSRWGAERFRHIFQRTVQACVAAGIAKGEIVH